MQILQSTLIQRHYTKSTSHGINKNWCVKTQNVMTWKTQTDMFRLIM